MLKAQQEAEAPKHQDLFSISENSQEESKEADSGRAGSNSKNLISVKPGQLHRNILLSKKVSSTASDMQMEA